MTSFSRLRIRLEECTEVVSNVEMNPSDWAADYEWRIQRYSEYLMWRIRPVLPTRNDGANFDVIVVGQHLIFSYQLIPSNHQVCFSQKV